MPSVISHPTQPTTSASIGRTDSGMAFLRAPAKKLPAFLEADAEKLLRDQGFGPATAEESRMIREAADALDARIARQLAGD